MVSRSAWRDRRVFGRKSLAGLWHRRRMGDDAMIRRLRMTIAQLKKHMDARFARLNRRFGPVDARLDSVDARLDSVDTRLDTLAGRVDRRFSSLNDKLDAIARRLSTRLDLLTHQADEGFRHHKRLSDEHEERLQDLERAARG
jgi:chromosome segregation ATPase